MIFGTRKTIVNIWRVKRCGTEKVVEKFQCAHTNRWGLSLYRKTQEIYGDPTVYHVTRNVNLWRPNSFGCHNCMLCDIVNVAWLKVLVSSLITQQFKYAYGWGLVSPAGVRVDGFRLGSRRLTAF